MRYVLRTRQAVLVAVGTVYVFVLAWFNRQPIPTTTLVHETDSALKLRTTAPAHLGTRNRDAHWLEPAKYLPMTQASNATQPPGVVNIDAGLIYIRLHTEFRTVRPNEPLGGMLKVYRKGLHFVSNSQSPSGSKGGSVEEETWELLFVDRLPGPVKQSYLDRTRLRNDDGTYAPRRLAVLYYMPRNETIVYRTRVYDLETLHRASFFDKAIEEVGDSWREQIEQSATDARAAVRTMEIATEHGLCPDDSLKFADTVYASSQFLRCVGPAGLLMDHIDFVLPGALDVLEFSLRGNTLLYSRLNDVVRFRMLELPAAQNGTLSLGGGEAGAAEIVQTVGPGVTEYLRDVGSQSFLAQLHSTRPGHSVDVFLAHGNTVSDTFYFSFGLLQNKTVGSKWTSEDVKRYRLPVHQQFSGLSRDELRLVNDPPLVDQVGLASVFYFKATDIIVVVDTEWFRDHGSTNVTQLQRVRESRPPYISTLNSPVAVNMTLDESGALLAMSTIDDELFIFSRAHASSIRRILDYRRYFRNSVLLPWIATEPVSSIDALEEGETDNFNWQLKLTWQPSTLMTVVHWDESVVSPENPFPNTQRFIARTQQQSTTTCLRFLHFDPTHMATTASASASFSRAADTAPPAGVIRVAALSASGRLRMWELDSHEQSPHILWPFITEHWGLMFMLAAVVSCCVYNERRWG
ncbi:hypothetical protein GGF37_004300 [Kickxella alabastrina]|nr:hypothetical protein GGF37_004300 [Kickxella alabastrina]